MWAHQVEIDLFPGNSFSSKSAFSFFLLYLVQAFLFVSSSLPLAFSAPQQRPSTLAARIAPAHAERRRPGRRRWETAFGKKRASPVKAWDVVARGGSGRGRRRPGVAGALGPAARYCVIVSVPPPGRYFYLVQNLKVNFVGLVRDLPGIENLRK